MDWVEIFGFAAGISLAISAIPQLIVIFREKSVHGVSLFTMLLLTFGNYCWLIYGIILKLPAMIIFDSISGTLYLTISILKMIDIVKNKKNNTV